MSKQDNAYLRIHDRVHDQTSPSRSFLSTYIGIQWLPGFVDWSMLQTFPSSRGLVGRVSTLKTPRNTSWQTASDSSIVSICIVCIISCRNNCLFKIEDSNPRTGGRMKFRTHRFEEFLRQVFRLVFFRVKLLTKCFCRRSFFNSSGVIVALLLMICLVHEQRHLIKSVWHVSIIFSDKRGSLCWDA